MNRLFFIVVLFVHANVFGQIKLARLFSDHVVMQRQKSIPIWGWAAANEKVTVTMAGQTATATADASGKWIVRINPLEAGGPYVMTVRAKSGKATVNDILIGEVWLCSGQSNMQLAVSSAINYQQEKQNADFPQIRHFQVDHNVTLTPELDLKSGEWKIASSETVGGFTAVGFFFARELYQKLKIPVGILHSSWGGSQIEGWISKEAMLENEVFKDYAQGMPKTWKDADKIMDAKLKSQLFKSTSHNPSADEEKAYLTGAADISKWLNAPNPVGPWDWRGLPSFRGSGYMAKAIDFPADWVAKESVFSLAGNDGKSDIYVNGKLISSETLKGLRRIIIPANTWKAGDNQLVIKMSGMVGTSGLRPGMPGKATDLYLEQGSQKISLSTEWKLMPSFVEKYEYAHLMNNVGTTIYNAMIAPLIPFAIKGTLWYQGEANVGRAYQYRQSFPLMINDWRKLWNDTFSFYWVQLSSYGPENDSNTGSSWAELREAQVMTLSLPKTGMAVTTDIGNPKDIHPTNKQQVGHRLAAIALQFDYGLNIVCCSPLYDKVKFEGDKAIVSFNYAEGGLIVKDKYGYLKGFEIAAQDGRFYFAKAEIVGHQVIVSHPKVNKPAAVRYGWSDSPIDGNLYNLEGFPASPFRTDTWPGVTINSKYQ